MEHLELTTKTNFPGKLKKVSEIDYMNGKVKIEVTPRSELSFLPPTHSKLPLLFTLPLERRKSQARNFPLVEFRESSLTRC